MRNPYLGVNKNNMLQLNKSEAINTITFYPNEVLPSGSSILLTFTQSYSNTVTGSIQADVISNPQDTPYVIATFSGSLLPSASGQYDFKIYELNVGAGAIWDQTITQWQAMTSTWNNASGSILGDLIDNPRAIISGSDVTPITEYVSPNENARYTVYLG
jgi:hypothetical protein